MGTVSTQIQSIDKAICQNIEWLTAQRALLSQNILSQLRNLIEGVSVLVYTGSPDAEFNYEAVEPGLAFVRSQAKFNFLGKFHKLIQASASHYTLDGDSSERLMLKYYSTSTASAAYFRITMGSLYWQTLKTFRLILTRHCRNTTRK